MYIGNCPKSKNGEVKYAKFTSEELLDALDRLGIMGQEADELSAAIASQKEGIKLFPSGVRVLWKWQRSPIYMCTLVYAGGVE